MNCDFQEQGGEQREGRTLRKCRRVGCKTSPMWVPVGNVIHPVVCTGLPLASEYREWLALFSDTFGLTRAASIVRYIRWRANGSPLEELPPGIPGPNIFQPLTPAELTELFPNEDPTLLGNRIKALTDALGIPTCGGCDGRRKWINAAHAYLRSKLDRQPGEGR